MSVKHMLNFSLWMGKSNETKVAEDYWWTMTKEVGRSHCSLSGSSMLEFGFQLDSVAYTYIVEHIHTQFWLLQNTTCYGPSRIQLLCKLGNVWHNNCKRVNFNYKHHKNISQLDVINNINLQVSSCSLCTMYNGQPNKWKCAWQI